MCHACKLSFGLFLLQLASSILRREITWWPFNRYDLVCLHVGFFPVVYHQQSSWGDMLSSCFRSHISTFATFAKGSVPPLGSMVISKVRYQTTFIHLLERFGALMFSNGWAFGCSWLERFLTWPSDKWVVEIGRRTIVVTQSLPNDLIGRISSRWTDLLLMEEIWLASWYK